MIGFDGRGAVWPVRIASGKRVAVAVVGQLAPELVDEQAAVREDQDAFGARGLDEAGGGDRLAGSRRMPEAVAAHGAGVLLRAERLGELAVLVALGVGAELELVVGLVVVLGLVVCRCRCRSRPSGRRRSAR